MRFKLDHVGFVVEKIDDFRKLLKVFNPDVVTGPVADPIQKVSASFVRIGGGHDVYVEILEPTADDSPINNFIRKRGGGLHHLCFEVDNIEDATKKLVAEGFKLVTPPVACVGYDENFQRECEMATKIAFFIMADKLLVELIEKPEIETTGQG